jgi:hypothetical protein
MIYLKTYFYSVHEFPFLKLNLLEAYPYIDKFIICEYNYTHTGIKREYIWDENKHKLPSECMDKVIYMKVDMEGIAKYAYEDDNIIHTINEPYMRGCFAELLGNGENDNGTKQLEDGDIVISVDADEIIYGESYPELLEEVKSKGIMKLNLHQFFYRVNYLWDKKDFIAPVICRAMYYKTKTPFGQWRYDGELYKHKVGCHFSWCMTVNEMLNKMECYSHPEYRFCAKREILEDAIKNKKYPFNSRDSFDIKEIDFDRNILIPNKMKEYKDDFSNLIFKDNDHNNKL